MKLERHSLKYLFKYRDVKTAELILKHRTIRCFHPSMFNDRLDGKANLKIPPADDAFKAALTQEYIKLVFSPNRPALVRGSAGEIFVRTFDLMKSAMSQPEIEEVIQGTIAELEVDNEQLEHEKGEAIRQAAVAPQILCLSEEWGSMAMWNHYGEGLRGCVIVFDCQADPASMFTLATPVQYADAIPYFCDQPEWIKVMTGQLAAPTSVLERQYFVKSQQWAYEKEWRLMAGRGGPGSYTDLPLTVDEFGGLVIGPETTMADEVKLTDLARTWRADCTIWKAKINYSDYELEINPVG